MFPDDEEGLRRRILAVRHTLDAARDRVEALEDQNRRLRDQLSHIRSIDSEVEPRLRRGAPSRAPATVVAPPQTRATVKTPPAVKTPSQPPASPGEMPAMLDLPSRGQSAVRIGLRVQGPSEPVRQEVFDKSRIKIGKLGSCHLTLDGVDVSRLHAIVEAEPGEPITLIDVGSSSGTFVNGQRINKAELQIGDKIKIGDFAIVVTEVAAR
ncbi:MAG: FHA domain-containing protein [Proteobacteria bacterium]|nr:FHA domain-containing protein [Pseudomonadota bacterium]